jgi:alkylhydroperoxidase family enzyme
MTTIPRIAFDDLPAPLADLLRPRVERLGYLGEFFRCMAHQPEALGSFIQFTEDLKHALPDRLTEVVALTVATKLGNAYEGHQHERLALKLGFGEPWIRAVQRLEPDGHTLLDPTEQTVQRFALAMIDRQGRGTADEREAVVGALGPVQAIAVIMLVSRYVAHALMVNCLQLEPPVASPFDRS